MQFLIRYWYIIILAFVLSIISAGGLLYLQRDTFVIAHDPLKEARAETDLPGMSDNYVRWNFEISGVENLKDKLQAEWESVQTERQGLELLRSRIQAETEALVELRDEIDSMRLAMNADFIEINEAEETNLKRLSNVYSEMKPDASVKIFSDLDLELVVMILSRMKEESASRVLAEMSSSGDEKLSQKAALITEMLRKVK